LFGIRGGKGELSTGSPVSGLPGHLLAGRPDSTALD
jgi:hypothetical protein